MAGEMETSLLRARTRVVGSRYFLLSFVLSVYIGMLCEDQKLVNHRDAGLIGHGVMGTFTRTVVKIGRMNFCERRKLLPIGFDQWECRIRIEEGIVKYTG